MNLDGKTSSSGSWRGSVVGIVCLFIVAAIDYHVLSEHIPWLYLAALGVLVYTLAFGRPCRWFQELGERWVPWLFSLQN